MSFVRRRLPHAGRGLALLLLAGLAAAPTRAHEGGHGDEAPPVVRGAGTATRSVTSELHELVVRAEPAVAGEPAHVHLLLADATTNAPIEGAELEVVPAGTDTAWNAIAIAPGVYDASVPDPERRLDVLVRRGDTLDLLTVDSLVAAVAVEPGHEEPGDRGGGWPAWAWVVAGLAVAGLVAARLLGRRAGRRRAVLLLLAGLGLGALGSTDARGHEGELHGTQKEATTGRTTGDRLAGSATVPAGARFIAKEAQFEVGVRTALVLAETLAPTRSAFGTVVADPGASAAVVAPQTGRFIAERTWRLGDRVRRGQSLGAVLVVDELPVRAPIGGTIAGVAAVPGQTVAAGQTLLTIVDLSRVRIDLPLYGDALAAGLAARTARVRLAALPERTFAARVEGLAPATEAGAPSAPLVLSVANPEGLLRPGMSVEVTLELPGAVPALTVPASALVNTEQGPALFVKIAPEAFVLRPVTLGARAGARVAIAHGVTAGEKVVVSGLAPLLATAEAAR